MAGLDASGGPYAGRASGNASALHAAAGPPADAERVVAATTRNCLPPTFRTDPGAVAPGLSAIDEALRALAGKLREAATRELKQAAATDDVAGARAALQAGADPRWMDTQSLSPAMADLIETACKINRLLWPKPRSGRESEMVGALRAYDVPRARHLLYRYGVPLATRWSNCVRSWDVSMQTGILALASDDEIRALGRLPPSRELAFLMRQPHDSEVSLLHVGLAHGTRQARLAAYLRSIPHLIPDRVSRNNKGTRGVVCRHLAVAWLEEAATRPGEAIDYRPFHSIWTLLEQTTLSDMEARFAELESRPEASHLVRNAGFGRLLATLLENVRPDEPRHILVTSCNHAMAAELTTADEDGVRRYTVRFYDPNLTTVHAYATTGDLHAVARWQLEDFMLHPNADIYFHGQDRVCMVHLVPAVDADPREAAPRPLASTDLDEPLANATALWHVLERVDTGDLAALHEVFGRLSDQEIIDLLDYQPDATRQPGVRLALEAGRTGILFLVGQALKQQGQMRPAAAHLLSRLGPRIEDALITGASAVISGYLALLRGLELTADRLAPLVSEPRYADGALLFWLMEHGEVRAMAALGDVLEASTLDQSALTQALLARRDGNSAYVRIVDRPAGRGAALHAYARLVQRLADRLGSDHLHEIATPRWLGTLPVLAAALQGGNADTLQAYSELMQACRLSEARRIAILDPAMNDAVHGIAIAAAWSHAEAVEAYGDLLARHAPPAAARRLLLESLTARNARGRSVLEVNGILEYYPEVIAALRRVLRRYTFAPDEADRINRATMTRLIGR